jgi:hypothetical protein
VRSPSPSSRLVLATVVVAILALAVTGRRSALPAGANPTPTSPAIALGTGGEGTSLTTPEASAFESALVSPLQTGQPRLATPPPTSRATPRPTVRATSRPIACQPTDQDAYVYNPDRLQIVAACVHVTGTIHAVRREADGDLHILLHLDPAYVYLLQPANQGEELGDLVVEPVCVQSVTQLDAEAACAADPDPLTPPFPVVGERVWMEGRYVFDLDHGGWAELHPLYRWGDA